MLANKATPAELAALAAPIVGAREKERRRTRRIKNAIAYVGLTVASFFMVVPFYYMILLALSERGGPGLFHWPPQLYPFWPLQLVNFPYVFEAIPLMGRYFVNSTFISVLAVAGTIVSSSIAAYAFARLKFPGSNVLFIVMLATLMIPPQVTLIPQFILFLAFDWYDTYYPLLVPHWTGSAFAIFLMRQYFMTIPRELEDAARVDGANPFTIYWRVVLPLSKPVLATLAILVFLGTWNDLIGPLIFLKSRENFTVQLGLAQFNRDYDVEIVGLMAGSLMSLAPPLTVFMLAQKYFVRGITLTGLKG